MPICSYDDMFQHFNADGMARGKQVTRQKFVNLAGRGGAGRMIVRGNQRRGIRLQSLHNNGADWWVYMIHGAFGNKRIFKESPLTIQVRHPEMLFSQPSQTGGEIFRCLPCALDDGLLPASRQRCAPPEFQRGLQLGQLCVPQAFNALPSGNRRSHHPRHGTKTVQQLSPQFDRTLPLHADAQKDSKQFSIGQRMRPPREQAFAGSFIFRPT